MGCRINLAQKEVSNLKVVSEELREMLLDQWVEEKLNANIYTHFGAWLKNKGLDNIGNFFIEGSTEEEGHAKQLVKLMTDLNIDFLAKGIPEFEYGEINCSRIGELFFARESQTTESLNEIKKVAIEEDCSIVEEYMRKMIRQQRAEMEEANTFMDRVNLAGGDMKTILLWDLSLHED
jgi:ferritin